MRAAVAKEAKLVARFSRAQIIIEKELEFSNGIGAWGGVVGRRLGQMVHALRPSQLLLGNPESWRRHDAERTRRRDKLETLVSPRWLHVLVPVKQEPRSGDRAELEKIAKLKHQLSV